MGDPDRPRPPVEPPRIEEPREYVFGGPRFEERWSSDGYVLTSDIFRGHRAVRIFFILMMLGGFVWASYELVAAFRASDVSGEWEYGIESCLAISLFAAMMTQPLNQRATVSITREMTRTNYTPWATKARPFAVKTVDVRGFVTKHRASASITSAGGWTTLYVRTRERDIEITLYDTLEDYPSLIRRVVARLEYALARVRYEEAMEPRPDGPPETPYRN